jgi:hypothetical protein
MKRIAGWPERLHAYLEGAARRSFAWGLHDCCTFACGAVQAMTGVDPMVELRGTYASKREALCRLRDTGGLDALAGSIAAALHAEEIPVLMAQRGDVVIADLSQDDGVFPSLGVVGLDGRSAVFAMQDGPHRVALRQCRRAWRV